MKYRTISMNWLKGSAGLAAGLLLAASVANGAEKLKVFILAGQSNMVGHCIGHTMATLFHADGPKDKALADMVFGKDAKLSKQRLDETLALAKQLDELTGGAVDPKIKAMTDPAQKAAAEAEAERMKATPYLGSGKID